MAYRIKQRTYRRARALGVTVKPSTRKGKKIDVFKNGKKVASVGRLGTGITPHSFKHEAKHTLTKDVKPTRFGTKKIEKRSERPVIMPTNCFGEFNFLNFQYEK